MRILVVEDETKTASFILKALEAEGFVVDHVADGREALSALAGGMFDAVVLDLMIPGIDGLGVLHQLRKSQNFVPVLVLSARGQVDDRISGLNAGADDYLSKPFALGELVARIRALCRRPANSEGVSMRLADLELNTVTRDVVRAGRRIDLSNREYCLLEYLLRQKGRVCTRMQIIEKVWDYNFDPGTNLVDVYIRRVRDKVDLDGEVRLLHTVRGVGYVMKEEI